MIVKRIFKRLVLLYYTFLCRVLNPPGRNLDPYKNAPLKRKISSLVPGRHNSAAYLTIFGEVSGVGYSNWLWRRARVLGLNGRVSVDKKRGMARAIFVGPGSGIEALILSAWKGNKRAKVRYVREKWFNKPVKSGANEEQEKKHVSWSQETADCIVNTLTHIESITRTPNSYSSTPKLVGTDELIRAADARNIYHKRYGKKTVYFSSPSKEVGIQRSQTTRVPSLVHSLTDNKQLTKDFLAQSGLPVPQGSIFTELADAKRYMSTLESPVVVKPVVGLNGSGVTVDVRTNAALETAWQYAKQFHETILLEELVQGVDVRIIVVGGRAKSALLRVPANVVGDGKSTVEELLEEKNILRLGNPRLGKNLIIADAYADSYLKRQNFSWSSVPAKGQVVFFHLKANICKGADSISITEYIHPDLMKLAEEAAAVFEIDDYWGIDLLAEKIDKPRDQQKCALIELNSTANIENVIYPLYGPPFDSAASMIDHLFPEELSLNSYPRRSLRLEIRGCLGERFKTWVVSHACELGLQGSIKLGTHVAEALVSGNSFSLNNFLDNLWLWKRVDKKSLHEFVDNLQVFEGSEPLDCNGFEVSAEPFVPKQNGKSIEPCQGTGLAVKPLATYPEDATERFLDEDNLNLKLFREEFSHRGYTAEPAYNDVVHIKKDTHEGFAGMWHSSLFCDRLCERISPAKRLLSVNMLPVASGLRFKPGKRDLAKKYLNSQGQTCIATAINPAGNKSVSISTEAELERFFKKEKARGSSTVLVEEYLEGFTINVAVVDGVAVCALRVEPVYVVGDGSLRIQDLIDKKNSLRKQNPWYADKLVENDEYLVELLTRHDKTVDSIPAAGERVLVAAECGMDYHGETVNITEELHTDFQRHATRAVKAIPGLQFAVVQMRIPYPPEPSTQQRWFISKIDTKPQLAQFYFPWRGNGFNLAKVVVDFCLARGTKWIKRG